jgi:hypothetical protein
LPERWSSSESVKAGKATWLAIIETILAVGFYWWAAWYWETHWHLLASIIVAPMLLLRSDQSTKLGAKWFYDYWEYKTEISLKETPFRFLTIIILAVILSGLASYFLASYLLPGHTGWSLFGQAFLLGFLTITIIIAGAVAGAVAVGTPFFFGIWLRSLATRIWATLRHLGPGWRAMPDNWRHSLLVVDFMHPPELLPGLESLTDELSFYSIFAKIKKGDLSEKIFYFILSIILFLPALLYRWSLKSTCWLYLPLIFLHHQSQRGFIDEGSAFVRELHHGRMENFRRFLSLGVIVSLVISHFSLLLLHEISQKFPGGSVLVYLLAFDWRSLSIWQFLTLPSLAITIFIYFSSDKERIAWEINSAAIPKSERVSLFKRLTTTRNFFTFLSLAFAMGYVLLALWLLASKTGLEQLPPALTFLKTLYGAYIK